MAGMLGMVMDRFDGMARVLGMRCTVMINRE